ncbi:hypothetical protein ACLM45_10420 [Synechococcus sp. A10-1-5-9]|uniref:hypothetical protein n=1 Tax=Synechococcus sp. A10-1-5-9 TaxID=3392295 RepID=UPI0039EBBC96
MQSDPGEPANTRRGGNASGGVGMSGVIPGVQSLGAIGRCLVAVTCAPDQA